MINLSDITHVQQRVAELQKAFGQLQQVPGAAGFESTLQRAMQRQAAAEAAKQQGTATSAAVQPTQQAAAGSAASPAQAGNGTNGTNGVQTAKTTLPISVGTGYRAVSDLPAANGDLSTLVQAAAQKENVDPRLVNAIAQAESGGDQSAVSPVGAIGVMQLMPDTAAGLGVDPYDEKQNVEGGAKYLREMLDTFGGDVKKAVAAYNAGPAAVKAYGGVPPYPETQEYVSRVLDMYR